MKKVTGLFLAVAALSMISAAAPNEENTPEKDPPWDPVSIYRIDDVEGWKVYVHPDLGRENPQLEEDTLRHLEVKLYLITRRLPKEAVEKLQTVRIFIETKNRGGGGMCFHPSAKWLEENGYNPEKAGACEIAGPAGFIASTIHRQPWAVLHELAHAYHFHFMEGGHGNKEVAALHKKIKENGTYDQVLHINGRMVDHYALTNPMEYFAESTEAYFGTNDFYPFVRSELKEHDPEMFALLKKVWGD